MPPKPAKRKPRAPPEGAAPQAKAARTEGPQTGSRSPKKRNQDAIDEPESSVSKKKKADMGEAALGFEQPVRAIEEDEDAENGAAEAPEADGEPAPEEPGKTKRCKVERIGGRFADAHNVNSRDPDGRYTFEKRPFYLHLLKWHAGGSSWVQADLIQDPRIIAMIEDFNKDYPNILDTDAPIQDDEDRIDKLLKSSVRPPPGYPSYRYRDEAGEWVAYFGASGYHTTKEAANADPTDSEFLQPAAKVRNEPAAAVNPKPGTNSRLQPGGAAAAQTGTTAGRSGNRSNRAGSANASSGLTREQEFAQAAQQGENDAGRRRPRPRPAADPDPTIEFDGDEDDPPQLAITPKGFVVRLEFDPWHDEDFWKGLEREKEYRRLGFMTTKRRFDHQKMKVEFRFPKMAPDMLDYFKDKKNQEKDAGLQMSKLKRVRALRKQELYNANRLVAYEIAIPASVKDDQETGEKLKDFSKASIQKSIVRDYDGSSKMRTIGSECYVANRPVGVEVKIASDFCGVFIRDLPDSDKIDTWYIVDFVMKRFGLTRVACSEPRKLTFPESNTGLPLCDMAWKLKTDQELFEVFNKLEKRDGPYNYVAPKEPKPKTEEERAKQERRKTLSGPGGLRASPMLGSSCQL